MSEYENKKTILVVDDEEMLRVIISKHLGRHFNVLTADNGVSALELYKTNNIDIVLTDVNLHSTINGLELLSEIKKINPYAKVYVMSAENHKEAVKAGAESFIEKPFVTNGLYEIIEKYGQ